MWGQLAASFGVVGLGVLLLWWAGASRNGTLPRQRFLGHRTPLTFSSHEAWVVVNRALAPILTVAGLGTLAAGLVAMGAFLMRAELFGVLTFIFGIGWGVVVSCLGAVPGTIAARRFKREREES